MAFPRRHDRDPRGRVDRSDTARVKVAASRGVTAIHDKDGWLGALRFFQRLRAEEALTLRVWQSLPHERVDQLAALGMRSRLGDDFLRIGYLKVLHGRNARVADGAGCSTARRRITSREELAEIVRRLPQPAGRWPCTRSATARTATRSTRSRRRATNGAARAAASGSSTRSASRRRTSPRFAALGVACSVQFSACPVRPRPRRAVLGRPARGAYAFRSLSDAGAVVANGSDAPIEELDPLAGIARRRAAHDRRTAGLAPGAGGDGRAGARSATTVTPAWLAGDERRRGKLLPGYLADLVVLDRDPLASSPRSCETVQVVATMVGGRWVHRPRPTVGLATDFTVHGRRWAYNEVMNGPHDAPRARRPDVLGRRVRRDRRPEMDGTDRPRPLRGRQPFHRARARLPRHQPATLAGACAGEAEDILGAPQLRRSRRRASSTS